MIRLNASTSVRPPYDGQGSSSGRTKSLCDDSLLSSHEDCGKSYNLNIWRYRTTAIDLMELIWLIYMFCESQLFRGK